mmetsp:Transcript_1753/g.5327  ORF Transcript_1753/g.5327 Transcript_1753/m.5327 type:complete len:120 (-) Transcript_1753:434-793(-)
MAEDTVQTQFGDLPVEVINKIMHFANFRVTMALALTCKSAYLASQDDELWKAMYHERWKNRGLWDAEEEYGDGRWKEAFRDRHHQSCLACDEVTTYSRHRKLCDACQDREDRHNRFYDD